MSVTLETAGFTLEVRNSGGKILESPLEKEVCPICNLPNCYFDCDLSQAEDSPESEDEALQRIRFNAAVDTLESFILACACADLDVESAGFQKAIRTVGDAIGNQFS